MITRRITFPLSEKDYIAELNIIKQIAANNGCELNTIRIMYCKKKNIVKPSSDLGEHSKYMPMTYHGRIHNLLQNIFQSQEYKVAYLIEEQRRSHCSAH